MRVVRLCILLVAMMMLCVSFQAGSNARIRKGPRDVPLWWYCREGCCGAVREGYQKLGGVTTEVLTSVWGREGVKMGKLMVQVERQDRM